MDSCYPTEAWSNIPAFQNIDEEGEFWDTHTLVDCGDEVCAELLDYGDDEEAMLRFSGRFVTSKSMPSMRMGNIWFVVESHPDTYISYPVGLKGVVVGQGDTFEEALQSAKSATFCHLETFGADSETR